MHRDTQNARQSLDMLLSFDEASPADWFHLELLCETCSRARERPLPGNGGARPLRGPDALFGLSNLRPFESAQVAAANAVYRACVRILSEPTRLVPCSQSKTLFAAGCGLCWPPWSNHSATKLSLSGTLPFRIMISTPVCLAPAGPKLRGPRARLKSSKGCSSRVTTAIPIFHGSLPVSQADGSIQPRKKLSTRRSCANFYVIRLFLLWPAQRPAVLPPNVPNFFVLRSEHPGSVKVRPCLLSFLSSNARCSTKMCRPRPTSKSFKGRFLQCGGEI